MLYPRTKSERTWQRGYPCPASGRRVDLRTCLHCADLQGAGMTCGREKPFTRREAHHGD